MTAPKQSPVVKEFWKSRTFWFNVAVVIIAAAVVVSNGLNLDAGQVGTLALGAVGASNLYLRFLTDSPVALKMPPIPFLKK